MPKEMSPPPGVLTVSEAAELLRVDPRTVVSMIDDGRLPAANIGSGERREFRIARSAIDKLLTRKAV